MCQADVNSVGASAKPWSPLFATCRPAGWHVTWRCSQSPQESHGRLACLFVSLATVGSVGNVESCFVDCGEEHMRQGPCGLTGNDLLRNGCVEHCRDDTKPVFSFETAPPFPPKHCRAVDEQNLLHVGIVGRSVEELLERRGEPLEAP